MDRHTTDDTLDLPDFGSVDPESLFVNLGPVETPDDSVEEAVETGEDPSLTLLERLDREQTGVLAELNQLNESVEHLIERLQKERQQTRDAA